MKILIVDDEVLSIKRLKRLLEEAGYKLILSAISVEESLSILEKNNDIDLIFIDIKMPEVSGIELAYKILSRHENIFIVFQTAYEEYALEAFKIGAIDYLLKPYTLEDVKRVLNRVEKFKNKKNFPRFMVKTLEGDYKIVSPQDIFYIKAELKESMLRTEKDYIYYPLSISKFEDKLKEYGFFRIHKSYLINVEKIDKIQTVQQSKLIFKFKGIFDNVISSKEGGKLFRDSFKGIFFRENIES